MDIQLGDRVVYRANGVETWIKARRLIDEKVVDGNIMCYYSEVVAIHRPDEDGKYSEVWRLAPGQETRRVPE